MTDTSTSGLIICGIWTPLVNNWDVLLNKYINTFIQNSCTFKILKTNCLSLFYTMSLIIHNSIKSYIELNNYEHVNTIEINYYNKKRLFTVIKPNFQIKIKIQYNNSIKYIYIYAIGDYNNENVIGYNILYNTGDKKIVKDYINTMIHISNLCKYHFSQEEINTPDWCITYTDL